MSAQGSPRRRRDRHGRGPRGPLGPSWSTLTRSRGARFADEVRAAVERVPPHYLGQLKGLRVVVTEVPGPYPQDGVEPVALARVVPASAAGPAAIVIHRRALEMRADGTLERRRLVRDVVAESLAELLGREPDELDPTYRPPED
ncbi:MAG: metallopeptidase family protein [Candidatus Nanopelagicales bacterium]